MTINVEELVMQLGNRYQDINDKSLIPYGVKPGDGDDEKLFIDLEQLEGVFLSFFNDKEQRLHQVSLTLEDKEKN